MCFVFLDTHTVPHFVNWETSQGCVLGSQNAEQSKRIVSLVVEIEMLMQKILKKQKNAELFNYFSDPYLYKS